MVPKISRKDMSQNVTPELIIGEWMKLRENRDEIVLSTKYSSAWQLANPKSKFSRTLAAIKELAYIF